MSQNKTSDDFTGLRGLLWPIHNFELKKFLPMGFLMMCILFNYNVLRDTKDTLVVGAAGSGAESLSYLKLFGVTPAAVLFIALFFKLSNIFNKEKLFYIIGIPFVGFFTLFGFIIYPNIDIFHMSLETMQKWQAAFPNLHWFVPVIGNWSFSLFYIFSELWGSVFVSMFFWQLANNITKMSEAKRFYALFGIVGNLGLLAAGQLIVQAADYAKHQVELGLKTDAESFALNIKVLMTLVTVAGALMLLIYKWIHVNVVTDPTLCDLSEAKVTKKKKEKMGVGESFAYILSNPHLLYIAVIVFAYGTSINLVEGVWKNQIKIAFPDKNDYSRFMGNFTFITGLATISTMILSNNLLRKLSWLTCALITPLLVLITSSVFFIFVWTGSQNSPDILVFGTFTAVMAAVIVGLVQNVLSKSTKYALFDATKQMAYMPLEDEAKTKGQAAVEVIAGRGGKSGGALIQSILLSLIGGGVSLASLTNILGPIVILVCLSWLISVFKINTSMLNMQREKEAKAEGSDA